MIQQDFRSSRALVRRTQGTLLRHSSKFIKKPQPGFQSVTKTGTFFLTRVVVPRSLKTVKRLRLDSVRKKWGEKHPHSFERSSAWTPDSISIVFRPMVSYQYKRLGSTLNSNFEIITPPPPPQPTSLQLCFLVKNTNLLRKMCFFISQNTCSWVFADIKYRFCEHLTKSVSC